MAMKCRYRLLPLILFGFFSLFLCSKSDEQQIAELKAMYTDKNSASIVKTLAYNLIYDFENSGIKGLTPSQIVERFGKAKNVDIGKEDGGYIVGSLYYPCHPPSNDTLYALYNQTKSPQEIINRISLVIFHFKNRHCFRVSSGIGPGK
jgi:hypothetical protein